MFDENFLGKGNFFFEKLYYFWKISLTVEKFFDCGKLH